MTLSFQGCVAGVERSLAEFMSSGTEGFARLNDAIFAGTHSVAGKIEGRIYVERNRRFREANHRPRHYDAHGCASAAKAMDGRERRESAISTVSTCIN
jgi:hypothetical protein